MFKKVISMLVIATIMVITLSTTVMAAPVEGKLKVEWYNLDKDNKGHDVVRPAIEKLRDEESLDEIFEMETAELAKAGELSQFEGSPDGAGLLMFNDGFEGMTGDPFKTAIKTVMPDKGDDPDYFGMKISGFITPEKTGKYTFKLWSDDNAYFAIDGKKVCDFWNKQHPDEVGRTWEYKVVSEPVELEAGKAYPITAEYWDGWGGNVFEVMWSDKEGAEADGDFTLIPAKVFSYDPDTKAPVESEKPKTEEPAKTEKPVETGDASMLVTLLVAGAATVGGLKFKKR